MPSPSHSVAVQLPTLRSRLAPRLWLVVGTVGLAAALLTVVALPGDLAPAVAVARLSGVVIPVGFGILRLARRRHDRFAMLLVGAGALWSLTTLAESSAPLPYSVGRVAVWLIEPAIIVLLLSFPSGRLPGTRDRRLALAAAGVALVLYVPTALLAPFPAPAPWTTTCTTTAGCPHDAFLLTSHASGLVDGTIRPLRETLTVVIFGLVALVLLRRAIGARRYLRLALAPVVAVAALRVVGLAVYFAVRGSGHISPLADALGWIFVLSLPIITLCFVAGLVALQLFGGDVLARLTRSLLARPSARELRRSLAEALRDPRLEIAFWREAEGRWADAAGSPVPDPADGLPPERAISYVEDSGRRLAAVNHEAELTADPSLMEGISAYVVAALDSDRLVTRLEESLQDLALSRARLVSVADEERRRIERDLHDGAQQQLVALRIKLELLADRRAADWPEDAAEIRALEDDIGTTLDEVRRFGRGVYPPLLADRGLEDALRAVARTAALPTSVDVQLSRRYPPDVESTVYFCAAEALQNACKHARNATRARITTSGTDPLRFEVRDDGEGFDPAAVAPGAGLTNMRDRLSAHGGTLDVISGPVGGTRVVGTIPLPAGDPGAGIARTAPPIA